MPESSTSSARRLTRRELCRAAAATTAGALLAAVGGCDKAPDGAAPSASKPSSSTAPPASAQPSSSASPAAPVPTPPAAQTTRSLVLYCSADSDVAQPIFEAFTKQTGIRVEPVYDTEVTKTTGLTNRLLQEKDRPRADLWWSSEPFGTIKLARAGALDDSTCQAAESDMQPLGGWPRLLRDQRWENRGPDGKPGAAGPRWYGFGSRARVIVYNTKVVDKADAPTAYNMLVQERFNGRIAMAKPQFGTTRGHMAMLVDAWDKGPFGDWLRDMKRAGLRLYDGNSGVVRAVANGECHVGLTDSDDVVAGKREGWPLEMSFIRCPDPNTKRVPRNHPRWAEMQRTAKTGTILMPNTVARVRGGPNASDAPEFIKFLLSKPTQRALAQSDSRNVPVDPDLAKELAAWLPPEQDIVQIDYEDAADDMETAMSLCSSILES